MARTSMSGGDRVQPGVGFRQHRATEMPPLVRPPVPTEHSREPAELRSRAGRPSQPAAAARPGAVDLGPTGRPMPDLPEPAPADHATARPG